LGLFQLTESAPLWSNLPAPVAVEHPHSMETFGQDYGYILYHTKVTGPVAGRVVVDDLGDFAAVYLDHRLVGTLDSPVEADALGYLCAGGTGDTGYSGREYRPH
jgi:hypothetical protein